MKKSMLCIIVGIRGFGCIGRYPRVLLLVMVIVIPLLVMSFSSYSNRGVADRPYQRGEHLRYRVYYNSMLTGNVTAGEVTFDVFDTTRVINGRNTHHARVLGRTRGVFNLFYKVNDRYETFIDDETLLPRFYIRRVDEGGHIVRQNVTFFQERGVASFVDLKRDRRSTLEVPEDVHDLLSMIYYARTLDLSGARTGDRFNFNFLIDDTVYNSSLEVLGREVIRTSMGHVRCIKLKPGLITGDVFSDEYGMALYVSDDRNKVPVLMSTKVVVGTVKMELTHFENLVNPFEALVPR